MDESIQLEKLLRHDLMTWDHKELTSRRGNELAVARFRQIKGSKA